MRRFAALSLAALIFSSIFSWPLPAQADQTLIQRGRAIARQNCARCHAIGKSGDSPNPKSPPFRTLAERYPLSNLEEALGEGIVVGHEGVEMPRFRLGAARIEALLVYLGSIQRK
jgi:mono/diheme cytochrome c family protein